MKIKVTQRLTYPEARKVYEQHKPEFTFSKVVSAMPKKPETKTASTQCDVKDSEITESSKVIIARIKSQNQNAQINQKSSSEKPTTQKQQNQTNTNTKQKVISDRMKKGSDDPIQNHNKFGALADDGAMDTDEGTMRSGGRAARPRSPVKAPK